MRLRIGICLGFEQGLKAVKFAQSASEVDSLKLAVKLCCRTVKLLVKARSEVVLSHSEVDSQRLAVKLLVKARSAF